jgi:hypothetical protein
VTDGLAPSPGPQRLVATACPGGGERVRRAGRLPLVPSPLRFPSRAAYTKGDVFGLCDVLARAEQVLIRLGEHEEAARVAAAFDLLEAGLT